MPPTGIMIHIAKESGYDNVKDYSEPEPADLQWSGQKIRLDFSLLMCYGITSLPILYNLVCMGIHSYIII